METEGIDYGRLVQEALRGVVRGALQHVLDHGLQSDHHFFITFRTRAEGVSIPPGLVQQYPEQMTIVLQNQFWNLHVEPEAFSVDLAFGGSRRTLSVPYAAVVAFLDPSVEFGLDLGTATPSPTADGEAKVEASTDDDAPSVDASGTDAVEPDDNVVSFDRTRRR